MADRTVSVKLQAEVGSYIAGMSKASAATMRLGASAESSAKQAKGGFDLAGKAPLLFGAAVVAGLGMAISKSMDFEKSMSGVAAATGLTGQALEDLRATAMKAGADTQYSATEAADAITEMAKAGVSAGDIMNGGLTGALNLAAAGQLDVAEAAGIASTAMTQFKLSGEDLPHVADLLAAGAGKAMGSVDDLGQALNQAGLIASSSGISIEETTGTLAAFASAGLLGSDAGTSFKTMLQALQNPSKESANLMEQYGISLYDAQGNMVGMSGLAGELQTAFGNLTPAVRDQAMAQIFGSDAVRAANVLYSEGATGITEWTGKVNDAGYAQKQAAALTDNLSGDLERLGGSFDTLLISVGSGLQGPLRELTQFLGHLVDGVGGAIGAFANLPGPIQLGVGALGGLALLNGPLSGVLSTVKEFGGGLGSSVGGTFSAFGEALGYARANGDGLGTVLRDVGGYAAGGFKAGLSSAMDLVGGPWGAAFIAATVVVGYLASAMSESTDAEKASEEAASRAASAQQTFADALRATNGVITETIRQEAAKAAQDAGLLDMAQRSGIALSSVTDALLGNREAYDNVKSGLEHYIQMESYASLATDGSHDAHIRNRDAAQAQLDTLDTLTQTLPDTIANQQQLTEATGESTGAVVTATPAAQALSDQLKAVGDAASAAKQQTDALKTALDVLSGAQISTTQAESDFYAAVDAAHGAMDNLSGSVLDDSGALNTHSESGRKAFDILNSIRDADNQVIATMEQHGATTEEVTARDAELRQSFIDSEAQMGITGQAAEDLADQILGIPADRLVTIDADTSSAADRINEFVAGLGLQGLAPMLQYNGQFVPGHAEGGYTGPGGKYQPAGIVHAGEIVWSQADIAAHGGVGQVEAMRVSRPGYADGGLVRAEDGTYVPASFYGGAPADANRGRAGYSYDVPSHSWVPSSQARGQDGTLVFPPAAPATGSVNRLRRGVSASQGFIGVNEVSAATWRELLGMGWSSRPGGRRETLYPPRSWHRRGSRWFAPGYADGGLVDFVEHVALSAQTQARMASAKASMTAAQSGASAAAPGAPVDTKGNAALVQAIAAARGWGSGPEWNALYALVNRESGFRNTAQNPTSTAYGLFQFLDSTWASYGKKTSDPGAQTKMGLSYIAGRYGDPIGAWGHETRFGWYEDGTNYVPADGLAYLHKGEAVIPAEENSAIQGREWAGMPGGGSGGGSVSVAPPIVKVYLDGQEWRGMARVEAEGVVVGALTGVSQRKQYSR